MEQYAPQLERELRAKYSHMMPKWYEMVNWTEPLILGLATFHLLLLVTVFLTRHRLYVQFALFVAIILLLVVTEALNTWARANWRRIATQQYFDQRGVFMGIFYGAPLLVTGFFQLMLNMANMVQMLILVKRAEFRQQLKDKKKQESKPHDE
ncbi:hypothetical protein Poli38472_005158 [Pythium oligandrum]|uniref:Transmembrane protein 18 n=1 Tax=Pythium oligandrum TaxID=41045 RepID=A0A8K1CGZ5_PYTOL|nr:hypothetical protein Poli38472_005158 [Pythium oligandrum]|eukprot:TMW62540.1 hypothetical protein Poli38472_005158 [Pythium oligandrum]